MHWALAGDLPASIDVNLLHTQVTPQELNSPEATEKSWRKWIKKNPELPVLVLVIREHNRTLLLPLLSCLRTELGNERCRIICYADDTAHNELISHIWEWRIHHLYRLNEFDPSLLLALIQAEHRQYLTDQHKRHSRSHEMELLTWLARMSRSGKLTDADMKELGPLFALITSASLLLHFDTNRQISSNHPVQLQELPEELLERAHHSIIQHEQTVSLQLDRNEPLHHIAGRFLGIPIVASVLISLRCYDSINASFVIFLSEQAIAQLDVAQMTLVEKTVEQTRTQLERQLSEIRLKNQYERLSQTLKKLHQAQEQLYHAEKLSAIGQLAAGIAHEINNPVSYVMSNFEPLDEYIQTMISLLKLHDDFIQAIQNDDPQMGKNIREAIIQQQISSDFEFMMEDVFALVSDSRKGLQRVSEIVKNLRNLSRRDSMELIPVNLSECVSNAIKIMGHQLKNGFTVDLEIPEKAKINGNEGMIVQVLINLIQNAIHAMGNEGTLTLKLIRKEFEWELSVSDTGCGIPEEIREKIFDPFFTTKEIGKGTGLGLSTVYSIMQNHKGSIRVDSKQGKGTRFTLSLPVLE